MPVPIGSPPKLSPVRKFAPIDMSTYSMADIEAASRKLRKTKITTTLESGAPELPEEASMSNFRATPPASDPATPARSPATRPATPKFVVAHVTSKLECVPEQDDVEQGDKPENTENKPAQKVRCHGAYRRPARSLIPKSTCFPSLPRIPEAEAQHVESIGEFSRPPSEIQYLLDKDRNSQEAMDLVEPNVIEAPVDGSKGDANLLPSCEMRAHARLEEGIIATRAQNLASENERVRATSMKDFRDNIEMVSLKITDTPKSIAIRYTDLLHSREVHGVVKMTGSPETAESLADKNEQDGDEAK